MKVDDRIWEDRPAGKIELIGGKFIVGNSLIGTRYLLAMLLEGYGAGAALPLADAALWRAALREGFRELDPPGTDKPLPVWQAWAAQVSFEPRLESAGPSFTWLHYHAATRLRMGLFGVAKDANLGCSIGGGVVVRLGDDAFMPDVMFIDRERLDSVNKAYVERPPEIIIEVTMPGHEKYEREAKRWYYEAAGVGEYWIVDPVAKSVELLRAVDGVYHPQLPGDDGRYRPACRPELVFMPDRLWVGDSHDGPEVFEAERVLPSFKSKWADHGPEWGDLAFAPRIKVEPETLTFEEFMSWGPEGKIEMVAGRPILDGRRGTRNTLRMALCTLGLADAVTLRHPREWIAALIDAEHPHERDAARRAVWWAKTRRAAAVLREKHGVGRLVAIGDLTRPAPLNQWSDVTLIMFEQRERSRYDLFRDVYELDRDFDIDLKDWDRATASERTEVEENGVEL